MKILPEYETAEWLNLVIIQLWKMYPNSISKVLLDTLEPSLQASKPFFVVSFRNFATEKKNLNLIQFFSDFFFAFKRNSGTWEFKRCHLEINHQKSEKLKHVDRITRIRMCLQNLQRTETFWWISNSDHPSICKLMLPFICLE